MASDNYYNYKIKIILELINHYILDRNRLDNFEQVAIAPLMSHLIGVPIPLNSIVGKT